MATSTGEGQSSPLKPRYETVFNEDKTVDVYVHYPGDPQPKKVPRTKEDFDQLPPFLLESPPKPPLPTEETLHLYARAIDKPEAITAEERLVILGTVPDIVVDTRCRERCGIAWEELLSKAVDRPEELGQDEQMFIPSGVEDSYKNLDAQEMRFAERIQHPEHVKKLRLEAEKAVMNPRYAKAKANAWSQRFRIRREREEAKSSLSQDDHSNILNTAQIPWESEMTRSPDRHWGLVCFRISYGDEETWRKYKEHLLSSSKTGFCSIPYTDYVAKKWKIHFVDDDKSRLDGASLEDLCKYIKEPSPSSAVSSAIVSGIRTDVFLYADAAAIASMHQPPPPPYEASSLVMRQGSMREKVKSISGYVNAAETFLSPNVTYNYGFQGSLKVHPAHVGATFYHRFLPKGQEKGNEDWWFYKAGIEDMYRLANGPNGRGGGIYPPQASWNNL